ncbi:MAG: anti-sigma factor [Flavobacterium sp.]|nr:anti-sigma factor [Flavobacterium sp.]
MDTKEYIESGVLELYVYGLLSNTENIEVNTMSKKHPEINDEILAIEKGIVALSSSFSPFHSVANFEKIKAKLEMKHSGVIQMKPKNNNYQYIGWAASLLLFVGIGYQYLQLSETHNLVVNAEKEKTILQKNVINLKLKNEKTLTALTVVRDTKNTVINLGGQAVSPKSSAKIYWNKETEVVFVDASGLPEPPKGMVYQIWSLKLQPQLTPTSIGLLSNFTANKEKIFAVEKTSGAEAFGITLEPAGGSQSPTMEQLYTLGKV